MGAPLYSVEYKSPRGNQKKLEMRSIGGKGDEGTVFVYLNNKGVRAHCYKMSFYLA